MATDRPDGDDDTGWLFEETLAYRDTLTKLLGLTDVRTIHPLNDTLAREDKGDFTLEKFEFDNLAGTRDFTANKAYGQSKLANALFSLELARRLAGTTTTSNSLNPGAVDTSLWRHYPKWQQALLAPIKGFLLKTPAQGAATQCYVATAAALAGVNGQYFENCNAVVPPPQVRDAALAEKLWRTSEELLRPYLA